MEAAQRLYAKRGFERVPGLDFFRGKRSYRVYELSIDLLESIIPSCTLIRTTSYKRRTAASSREVTVVD